MTPARVRIGPPYRSPSPPTRSSACGQGRSFPTSTAATAFSGTCDIARLLSGNGGKATIVCACAPLRPHHEVKKIMQAPFVDFVYSPDTRRRVMTMQRAPSQSSGKCRMANAPPPLHTAKSVAQDHFLVQPGHEARTEPTMMQRVPSRSCSGH